MNNQEYYDYEDRRYVNPVTSRDEQLAFANNLRSVANNNIAKIKNDTYNLGTHVPSNLGGLTGSTGLWNRNFVSPKVESMAQGLRAVAQSSALENAMNNYLNQKKQQYQNAYKAAAKRAASRGGSGGGGGYTTTGGSGGSDLAALLEWMAQNGYDVDTENAGSPNTEDTLTKGDNSISLNAVGDAITNTGGAIPWRGLAGTIIGGVGGPMGAALGGVIGNAWDTGVLGNKLGWWGK